MKVNEQEKLVLKRLLAHYYNNDIKYDEFSERLHKSFDEMRLYRTGG